MGDRVVAAVAKRHGFTETDADPEAIDCDYMLDLGPAGRYESPEDPASGVKDNRRRILSVRCWRTDGDLVVRPL